MNKWKIPNKNPYQDVGKFPLITMLAISFAIFLVFITYRILNWQQGEKVTDELISITLSTPLILVLVIWCVVGMVYCYIAYPFCYAGFLEKYGMNRWQNWARQALPLLDYSSILPVSELALKMQKLEDEAPTGAATPLRIAIEVDSMDDVRVDKVLRQLIEPLKNSLVRQYSPFKTWLYVKGADDSIGNSFKAVLESLSVPKDKIGEIKILHECPDYYLINDWIGFNMFENNLIVTVELHSENDSDFFESANAFVFTDDRLLESKDTPLYLLRMMDSTPYYLDEIVNIYLSAQQVVIDKIKRLWFSSLDKQSKFVMSGAIENAKTGILPYSRYELETVTGKSSEVQRWVVLALAADAAKYGQGHQLFASKSADIIQSGIITAKYPGRKPAPDIADFSNYWKIISACSIILWCTGYLCLVSEETFNIHPWYSIVPFVVGILVIFIAVLFFSIFVSNKIEQEMGIYYS